MTSYLGDIRRAIIDLLERIEDRDLPMFYGMEPDPHLGKIEVNWMLQENREGSRAVIAAYPGEWRQARSSKATEPIFEYKSEDIDINLWAHPEAVTLRIEIP